jgi:hypothetical protein
MRRARVICSVRDIVNLRDDVAMVHLARAPGRRSTGCVRG